MSIKNNLRTYWLKLTSYQNFSTVFILDDVNWNPLNPSKYQKIPVFQHFLCSKLLVYDTWYLYDLQLQFYACFFWDSKKFLFLKLMAKARGQISARFEFLEIWTNLACAKNCIIVKYRLKIKFDRWMFQSSTKTRKIFPIFNILWKIPLHLLNRINVWLCTEGPLLENNCQPSVHSFIIR